MHIKRCKIIGMEKFSIEIETAAGWITYHQIMRPGEDKVREVFKELQEKSPDANFRIVKWTGEPL